MSSWIDLADGSWTINRQKFDTESKREAWLRSIDRHQYRIGKVLGHGAFGSVYTFDPTHKLSDKLELFVLKRVSIESRAMVSGEIMFTRESLRLETRSRHNRTFLQDDKTFSRRLAPRQHYGDG